MGALGSVDDLDPHPAQQLAHVLGAIAAGRVVEVQPIVAELDAAAFAELLRQLEAHRLIGTLAEWVISGDLALVEHREALAARHLEWMTQAVKAERVLTNAARALHATGIEPLILKGPAIGRLAYDEPAARVFLDIDLLVRSDDLRRAIDTLVGELGGRRLVAEVRPGADQEFGKEVVVTVDGIDIDVHRTLIAGPFGHRIHEAHLADDSVELQIGELSIRTVSPTHMFLHACFSAALGDIPPRLGTLRDVLLAWERFNLQADQVVPVAARWGALAVLQRAAWLTVDALGLATDHPLASLAELPVARREARWMRWHLSSRRKVLVPLASLESLSGTGARVRYALGVASPSRAYLDSRGWSRRQYLRHTFVPPRGVRRG
jgi:hypothetical protein